VAQATLRELQSLIQIYRALGGGWETSQEGAASGGAANR